MKERHVLDRRSAVAGLLLGVIVGGAGGYIGGLFDASRAKVPPPPPPPGVAAATAASLPSASTSARTGPTPLDEILPRAHPSFAQQGEDLVMLEMLSELHVDKPTYLDIGAHDPIFNNNTYLMHVTGGAGVLVEPNPAYAQPIRRERPGDVLLEIGVGVTDQAEADYYVFEGDGQANTFSKEQADLLVSTHRQKLQTVMKRRLVRLDAILAQYFPRGAPDVLSIDIEGMDLDVLRSNDWGRWRPRIVCVETSQPPSGDVERDILDLMARNGYEVRGGSYVNTIFLESRDRKRAAADAGAGAREAGR